MSGSLEQAPASWSYTNPLGDGVWDDDGPTSLDTIGDGLYVRFTRPGPLDVDSANDAAYVDVVYDPPDVPSGATLTTVAVWYRRNSPPSGTGVVPHEFLSADGATTYASDSGTLVELFTTDAGQLADIKANGCIWRMHSASVEALTRLDRAWMFVMWEGGDAWPLRVVSAAGEVWRVGPTENPDGGIMRHVKADGSVWIQDAAGTLPWRLVGAAGDIVELPMSGGWITPTVEVTGDMRSWALGSEGDVLDRSDFATSAGEAWAGTGGTGNPYGMSLQSFTVGSNASAGISEGIMSISWRAIMDAAVPAFSYPGGATIDPDDEGSVVSAQVVAQMSETVVNDGPTSIRQIAQADYDVISGPIWQTPALISAAPVVLPAAGANASPIPVTFDITWDDVGGGSIKTAFYVTSIDNYAPGGGTWDPDVPQTALLEAVGSEGSGNPPQWSATVHLPRYHL